MPSLTPSSASQALSAPSITSFLSDSDSACRTCGTPCAFFGATVLSIVATHSSPMPEKFVRIAGAPAITPSK